MYLLLSAMMLGGVMQSAIPAATAATARAYYVDQTGHSLADPFLTFWGQNDGMNRLGLPVTEAVDIDERTTQFFEFGALVDAGDGEINRVKVGRDLLDERHYPDATAAGKRVGTTRTPSAFTRYGADAAEDGELFDDKTGHTVGGDFLTYYEEIGGKGRLGRPLSEASSQFGVKLQWFELGRIELDDDGSFQVGPAGYELARELGVSTRKTDKGNLPLFDPASFRFYSGDGTIPNALGRFAPVQIMIPAIGVDSYIEVVGIVDGVMQIPQDAWAVGWYQELASPGEDDNIVMAGHRDWWGVGPVVFYNLGALSVGDRVYLVGEDGSGSTYEVVSNGWVDASTDARDVIGDTTAETLTLITCGGDFTGQEYLSRNIIKAVRI